MNLENQVVSLELAKKLKELGVKQESYFRWCLWNSPNGAVIWDTQTPELATDLDVKTVFGIWEKGISAFTVAELGEMLPAYFTHPEYGTINLCEWKSEDRWTAGYRGYDDEHIRRYGDTQADACASMLIYLIENHLITLIK